jgi:hypothetical protein
VKTHLFSATSALVALGFAASLSAQTPEPQQPQPQTQPQQQQERQQHEQHRADDKRTATVVGCLERGEEPNTFVLTNARITPDAAGTTGVGQPGDRPVGQPEDRPVGQPGDRPAGQPGAQQPGTQPGADRDRDRAATPGVTADRDRDRAEGLKYKLTAGPNVNLQQHVGQQVRVTGMFVPDAERDRTMAPGTQPGQVGTAGERPETQQDRDRTAAPGQPDRDRTAERDERTRATDRDIAGHLQVQSIQRIADTCPQDGQQRY